MKKKLRKLLKKNFTQVKNAFSMVEIAVSMIIIAIIIAALTPIITKRLTASSTIKNRISTNCDGLYTNGYCAMCYLTPKQCIVCTIPCATGDTSNGWKGEVKNNNDCKCESCTKHNANCANCTLDRCTQCKPGYYLEGEKTCTPCPAGKYCDDGKTPKDCNPGTANDKTGQTACPACVGASETQVGTYQPDKGKTSCLVCNPGTYAKGNNSTSCDSCLTGRYCTGGKIIRCRAGEYQDVTGQSACKPCVASNANTTGNYSKDPGATKCTNCKDGYYAKNARATSCDNCPPGSYCPSGKRIYCAAGTANPSEKRSTKCDACVPSSTNIRGTYASSAGWTKCEYCLTGYYTNKSGATGCSDCPAGYYCPDSKKILCPKGSYSTGGKVTGCTSCGPNMTTDNAGASSSAFCKSIWNCSTYGGTVSGSLCYKYTSIGGSCSGTTAGHTWRKATLNDVKAIQKVSVQAQKYSCYYSRYQGRVCNPAGCYAYIPKAAYTTSGYYSRYQGYIPGSTVAATATYGITYNCPGTMCVTNN